MHFLGGELKTCLFFTKKFLGGWIQMHFVSSKLKTQFWVCNFTVMKNRAFLFRAPFSALFDFLLKQMWRVANSWEVFSQVTGETTSRHFSIKNLAPKNKTSFFFFAKISEVVHISHDFTTGWNDFAFQKNPAFQRFVFSWRGCHGARNHGGKNRACGACGVRGVKLGSQVGNFLLVLGGG